MSRSTPVVTRQVPDQWNQAAATGRPLQWETSDRPAALAAYLNWGFLHNAPKNYHFKPVVLIFLAVSEGYGVRNC